MVSAAARKEIERQLAAPEAEGGAGLRGVCVRADGTATAERGGRGARAGHVKVGTGGDAASRAELAYAAEGLRRLRAAAPPGLTVPEPWLVGELRGGSAFIVMDKLRFGGGGDAAALGRGLAALHSAPVEWMDGRAFGFPLDGCCGAAPQPNAPGGSCRDWVEFWREHRLGHQLRMASERSPQDTELQELGAELSRRLPELFSMLGEPVRPSLLHGDLWSGNWSTCADSGGPCIYDPAAYYGHDEADLGIARMFGGFPDSFWEAYHAAIPRRPGHERRALLYELHHHLNHYNIFGRGYRHGAVGLMRRILGAAKP